MPAFSVTNVGGSNANAPGSEAVNVPRDQMPQGYANVAIDPNKLAKAIEFLNKTRPLQYFSSEAGSPVNRKEEYFYLWLAAKTLGNDKKANDDTNYAGFAIKLKARVNAMDKIGDLEKDLEKKIKGNTGDYVNVKKILTLINDGSLSMNDSDKVIVLVAFDQRQLLFPVSDN